jgi:F-type H+-transporting ATPase subunit b
MTSLLATAIPTLLAAEGGEAANPVAFNWVPFVAALIIFVIVLGVLSTAVWPKILKGLDDRAAKIREEIFAAEESRKAAAEMQANHTKEIAASRAESQRLVEQARAEATRTAADLKVKAEAEIAQMREQAIASIEAAKKAAVQDIYNEAAGMATAAASKILERELNPADQARLIETSLTEFRGAYAGR